MLFFWSKSYEGLDALRDFLGHTDTEHLYHYITENINGEQNESTDETTIETASDE